MLSMAAFNLFHNNAFVCTDNRALTISNDFKSQLRTRMKESVYLINDL